MREAAQRRKKTGHERQFSLARPLRALAWHHKNLSKDVSVNLLREPFGRPAGLPLSHSFPRLPQSVGSTVLLRCIFTVKRREVALRHGWAEDEGSIAKVCGSRRFGDYAVANCCYSLGSISRLLSSGKVWCHPQKILPMTRQILVLTAVTFALVSGAIGARAEEDSDDAAKMQQREQVQQSPGDEDDTTA
jgi:hypothetical protein